MVYALFVVFSFSLNCKCKTVRFSCVELCLRSSGTQETER